jgi:hypothetical protein
MPRKKKPAPAPAGVLLVGRRTSDRCEVLVTTISGQILETLNPRLDLWNHSPTGFNWGYCGSGPAQLALAIIAFVTGDDEVALRVHQEFKFDMVARFPAKGWVLNPVDVRSWMQRTRDDNTMRDALLFVMRSAKSPHLYDFAGNRSDEPARKDGAN